MSGGAGSEAAPACDPPPVGAADVRLPVDAVCAYPARLGSRVLLSNRVPKLQRPRHRLPSHPGRLWRLTAGARVPVTFLVPVCSAVGGGLVGWSDRGGVLAGIEPALYAGLTTYVGLGRVPRCEPHLCIIDANVTLARRETWLQGGGGARPKGAAPSSAQVWTIRTAPAEPKRATFRWRSRRARRPPGRHLVRERQRERSGALPNTQGAGARSDSGAPSCQRAPESPLKQRRRVHGWPGAPSSGGTVFSHVGKS